MNPNQNQSNAVNCSDPKLYASAVRNSLLFTILSAVLLIVAAVVWWFVSAWIGIFLALAAEIVATIPNTMVRSAFKRNSQSVTDKKQRKALEKALRKQLRKENGAFSASFVLACVSLVCLIIFVVVAEFVGVI